jgi:hypothetical protein
MVRWWRAFLSLTIASLCAACVANATPAPPSATPTTVNPPTATPTTVASTTVTASSTPIPATATSTAPQPTDTPPADTATLAAASATASTTPPPGPTPTSTLQPPASATPTAVVTQAPAPTTPSPASTGAPSIQSFQIEPQTINPGDSVTLSWQASGEQAAIYWLEPGGPLNDMHTVPLSGTLTIQTPDVLRNQVQYVLFVGAGQSTTSATVTATIRCPDKWFFASPPSTCPQGPAPLGPMAVEHFQNGLMLWLSAQNQIFLLFNGAGWAEVPNGWSAGQPESDPSLVPPAGLYQPVRGFGAAWRSSDLYGGQTARDRLGWATEPESSLTGAYQCDSSAKYTNCFISGPGGLIYWLKPELSAWQVWPGHF